MTEISESLVEALQDSVPPIPLQSDDSLLKEREEQKKERDKKYTELVKNYASLVKNTVQFKTEVRCMAFYTILFVFGAIVLGTIALVVYIVIFKDTPTIGDYSAIIASMMTLISSIIIIPQKIVDFIFNQEEEKYMVEVIKNTQDFDKR